MCKLKKEYIEKLIELYNNKVLCVAAKQGKCLCAMCHNTNCKKKQITTRVVGPEDYD